MSDEQLRQLERAAVDAPTIVRYAEALARLGRTAAALDALLPAVGSLEVRRFAGSLDPTDFELGPAPNVAWAVRLDGTHVAALHASPLAVGVVMGTRSGHPAEVEALVATSTFLLDPRTGKTRSVLADHHLCGVFQHVALVATPAVAGSGPRGAHRTLTGVDAVTGRGLWTRPFEKTLVEVERLSWPDVEREPGELLALPAPRVGAAPTLRATFETRHATYSVRRDRLVATDGSRVVWEADLGRPAYHVIPCHRAFYVLCETEEVVCLR